MPDIVVLGATGFTGRLISRYLASHPQRGRFTWAVAARSKSKLDQLVKDLSLPSDVEQLQFNVSDENDVERVVKVAKVVINTVGPYCRYGTPVVRACVVNAVHYVDLTGERPWMYEIVALYDYAATKTGAIIVPACGTDSVPSDLCAYLSNKTLKAALEDAGHQDFTGKGSSVKESLTAYKFKGGISGGTLGTVFAVLEDVDRNKLILSNQPYALSPVVGVPIPRFQSLYKLAVPGEKPIIGGLFVMRGSNTAVVQRSFGLLEKQAIEEEKSLAPHVASPARKLRYGPLFKYDEFMIMRSAFRSLLLSYGLMLAMLFLVFVPPIRRLVQKYLPQPGEGPSEEEMKKGYLVATNLTTSATSPPVQVKTVLRMKGDPGYLMTSIMISESALSLLLPPASANSTETTATYSAISTLPHLARKGGVLTPATAFGDILAQRLADTEFFEFSSSVVGGARKAA